MSFPIKICALCGEEFELKPNKPGFANRCWDCSVSDEPADVIAKRHVTTDEKMSADANEARRKAMRDLLYRKDS